MAVGSALRNFAKGGVVIEGRGAKAIAAAAAIAALTAAGPVMAGAGHTVASKPAVATTVPYQEILRDVRAQVEAEFPGRIFIVDRSADPRAEAARLAKVVGLPSGYSEIDTKDLVGGPHSQPYTGARKSVCLVVGAEPSMTAKQIHGLPDDMPARMGALDDAASHRDVLWHEVGHCLLGRNEAKADVFGALKSIAERKSTDLVETKIVTRELSEWLGPLGDKHHISGALRRTIDDYGTRAFVGSQPTLSVIARIADKTVEPDAARTAAVRDALARTRVSPDQRYFVPVKEGFAITSMFGWIRASSAVPEFRRITELCDYLSADPATRSMPKPFVADPARSAKAIAALAAAGDPVARRTAPAFGAAGVASDRPIVSDPSLPSARDVEGRTVAFDRSSAVVQFTNDFVGFLVRHGDTRRPLIAGNARQGVTKTFGARTVQTAYSAEAERPSAPKM